MTPAEPLSSRIGKYTVTAEIGIGGFGRVYSAIDPTVGRTVAIKIMSTPDDEGIVSRFRSEAKTVANLHHRNIVTVYEFGEEQGTPYLVMEYLDGATLETLIQQKTLSLLEKIEIMAEVAEGLKYAHAHGVVHRDVKPANIMRLTDGSVKIMDFGIARITGDVNRRHTAAGSVIGSLRYMAPEQFTGTADARSDIFAFGVTFYEALTGYNPFAAADPAMAIYHITKTDPPPLRAEVPDCPEALELVMKRLLAKAPEARYSSFDDVVLDLRPIVLDLRRQQGAWLYSQAGQLFASGELESAGATVRKALDLDPMHPHASTLRFEIEQVMQRREAMARTASMFDGAERELSQRRYEEAASILSGVPAIAWSVPELQTRFEDASARIESMRAGDRHLAAARQSLDQENYTEALRAVSEALAVDQENAAGHNLLRVVRTRIASRDARRRFEEEIARIDGLLAAGKTAEVLDALAPLEQAVPGAPQLVSLRSRAETQKAREERAQRLGSGMGEARALVNLHQFGRAIETIDRVAAEFPESAELQALRREAEQRLAAERAEPKPEVQTIGTLAMRPARSVPSKPVETAPPSVEAVREDGPHPPAGTSLAPETRCVDSDSEGGPKRVEAASKTFLNFGGGDPPKSAEMSLGAADTSVCATSSATAASPTARSSRSGMIVGIAAAVLVVAAIGYWVTRPKTQPAASAPSPTAAQSAGSTTPLSVDKVENPVKATVGTSFLLAIRSSGGSAPIDWSAPAGSLPAGVTLDPSLGTIEGVTAVPGRFAFRVTATDAAGKTAGTDVVVLVEGAPETAAKSAAPAPSIPPPCQSSKFVLDQYGDALSGELVWTGSLAARDRFTIQNRVTSTGRVQGDVLPQNVPVRLTVSPASVRLTTSPSPANCWAPALGFQNGGAPASEIHVKWQVFQP